ncbi:MAG: YtfJ family protein [Xanthomonadales bacterium]|nr:YtfJ family protein [Xanthomonadales bacterium]
MNSARLSYLAHIVTFAMLFQTAAFAAQPTHAGVNGKEDCLLEPGQSLPVLDIQSGGEISVSDNSVTEKPWSSRSFESKGKVQLVQYVSANLGAVRQNKLFNDALKERRYSSEQLETTIIVHMADTMSFVKGLVVDKMAKNKVKHQTINFVIDKNAVGLQRWGMKNKSYAVIVLDSNGRVLFAKDGPLSEIEVESTIKLIEHQMI